MGPTTRVVLAILSCAILSCCLVVAGCGGDDAPADAPAAAGASGAAAMMPLGNAAVTGTVRFEGTPPERQAIQQARECAALHQTPVLAEKVVVNDNGTLKWVFVYVKEGLADQTFPPSTEPVVLDQEGCMYTPHVFGMQTGQPLKIVNSDPLLHNIHALPDENRPFNFGMPNQGDERERSFREREVMVPIKCDVHPWMSAYAGVLDHPYFGTTGDDGTFRLEGLPAGTYVIEAWHEEYGTQTQTVTVGEDETKTADFTFSAGTPAA